MTVKSINRKVSGRELRRTLVDSEAAIREALVPAVQGLEHNDQVTRARLDVLEGFLGRSLWQRLRWVLMGR